MKRFFLNIASGIYFYYNTGTTKRIPYFSTIAVLVLMFFVHTLQIGIVMHRFLGITLNIFPIPSNIHRGFKYLLLAIYFTPIYLILVKMLPKSAISNNGLTISELKKNRNLFFIYAFLNVVLIVALISDKIAIRK